MSLSFSKDSLEMDFFKEKGKFNEAQIKPYRFDLFVGVGNLLARLRKR